MLKKITIKRLWNVRAYDFESFLKRQLLFMGVALFFYEKTVSILKNKYIYIAHDLIVKDIKNENNILSKQYAYSFGRIYDLRRNKSLNI